MNGSAAYLVKVELEGHESERWQITDKPLMIGRNKDADVILYGRKVSRVHCLISIQKDGNYVITDMFSTNGTHVNGLRITNKETLLQAYDRISIGEDHFIFKLR